MRHCIALIFVACMYASCSSAQTKLPPIRDTSVLEAKDAFPRGFIGNWRGIIYWYAAGKQRQSFTMKLRVQPTVTPGKYTWQIIYGDKEEDVRPYELIAADSLKGLWNIDEKNGIILNSSVHGNVFHGAFTVDGNMIVNNYWVERQLLHVEFFTIKMTGATSAGKGKAGSPHVENYPVAGYQKGVLVKEN